MSERHPYHYLRGYGRYVGLDRGTITARVLQAQRQGAPADAYGLTAEGQWLTVDGLRDLARGSAAAADLLAKIQEYAGEGVA